MVINNGMAPCGTMSRCCCCNMRLICAKSPYYVINSGNGSSDKKLEEIEALIQQLIQSQSVAVQSLADLETKTDASQTSLNTITTNLVTLQTSVDNLTTVFGEFAQDSKTKLDEIYAKVENIQPATLTNEFDTPIDVDAPDVLEDDSKSLAVLSPKEEETILVEKKGLFGKSKWVEQKK